MLCAWPFPAFSAFSGSVQRKMKNKTKQNTSAQAFTKNNKHNKTYKWGMICLL